MPELRVVECRGTPHDRGVSHGEQTKSELREFYGVWIERACRDLDTTEKDLISYAAAHLPASREYAPDLVAEVAGIAEGGELPFECVFLLNCFDEVACHGPILLKHGCTAFAATGRATSDARAYIGQGWDHDDDAPVFLLRLSGDDMPATLVITEPGVVGGAGINQHRLGIVWSTLKANDAGVGVPAPFIVRKALQADNLADLVGNVISSRRANGMNFIAADVRAAVDVELSATKYHVKYCDGILGHANHFEAPPLLQFEADLPFALPDTLLRAGRMRAALSERHGSIDLAALKDIMADHCSGPASICRHSAVGLSTTASLVYDMAGGTMWATGGNPCTEVFVEYSVDPDEARR